MPLPDDQPHTRTRLPVGEQASGQPTTRQPRPLRTLLTVLVVVTLLVVAISIANNARSGSSASGTPGNTGHSAGAAPPGGAPTAPSGDQPVTASSNGIGTGYPHTDHGAQSAAANYAVALGGADMFQAAGRTRILDTIADPAAAGGLRGALDQATTPAVLASMGLDAQGRAPVDLTFVNRTAPVGTKTDAFSPETAKVEVWCAGMSGLSGQNSTRPVTASWFTFTITLHWTGGDWKVSAFSRANGPVPLPADQQAATSDQITGAVQQFGGFRYAR